MTSPYKRQINRTEMDNVGEMGTDGEYAMNQESIQGGMLTTVRSFARPRANNSLVYAVACSTLAFIVGVIALILINVIFGFWFHHATVSDGLQTDHQIYIFGEPAVRLGNAEFFLLDAMTFGSQFVDLSQIDGKRGISVVIQTPPSIVADIFPGPASIAISEDVAAFEQRIFASNYFFISDLVIKENLQSVDNGVSLNAIMQLTPKSYQYKGTKTTQTGFVAQEVKAILPEAVSPLSEFGADGDDEDSYLGVNIVTLLAHTVNALQNMEQRLKTMESLLKR